MHEKQYKREVSKIAPHPDLINQTKVAMLAEMCTNANSPVNSKNKEKPTMKKSTFRRFGTVAAAFIAVMLFASTAFAAWYLLRPSDVADRVGNTTLSAAFESDTAININSQVVSGENIITLLAVVSGQDITDHPIYSNTGEILHDRTYAVLAIQNVDGSPMPMPASDEFVPFTVSPFVRGVCTLRINAFTMYGGGTSMIYDGVMYILTDFSDVTMFADMGVYLGVNAGIGMGAILDAFDFDQDSGEIALNSGFEGANAIFHLPLDVSLADPVRAGEFLDGM